MMISGGGGGDDDDDGGGDGKRWPGASDVGLAVDVVMRERERAIAEGVGE